MRFDNVTDEPWILPSARKVGLSAPLMTVFEKPRLSCVFGSELRNQRQMMVPIQIAANNCGPSFDDRNQHIQIPYFQRVLLDELAAGFDFVAHEDPEEIVGGAGVFHGHLKKRAVRGV